ncbi:nucleotidyltransferase family protein [Pseudomarimonas arenosa]|uniref:Nucleotidyltransferase family protein n=1 Tax=Pseudomarimonas arenosa TaxID=2774145 RepID=A0AAW3ZJF9_9GAMM|nr:nucleotidyltransferase family protein [Pseudomarimonas arenosa]MBD8525354.1 nucleotidyltransferase family protein [Pseudomarimonas arenosa]
MAQHPHLRIAILAAGESKRLGQPKQLVPINGIPLLQHAINQAAPLVEKVWVVLGKHGDLCWQALSGQQPLRRINVSDPEPRLSASLRTAASHAKDDPHAQHLLLMLVDQYRVDTAWLNALIQLSHHRPDAVIASHYHGIRGVPALFPRRSFTALQTLHGDQGARYLLRQASEQVVEYRSPQGPGDVDSESDLAQL